MLACQRPRHVRHVLENRPLVSVNVVQRLHCELHGLLRVLLVLEVHVNGVHPLATIVVEDDLIVCNTTISSDGVPGVANSVGISRIIEHAQTVTEHQMHRTLEVRAPLRRLRCHKSNGERVRAHDQVVHRGSISHRYHPRRQRDVVEVEVVVGDGAEAVDAELVAHAIAEHFHAIHVNHATVLVTQR